MDFGIWGSTIVLELSRISIRTSWFILLHYECVCWVEEILKEILNQKPLHKVPQHQALKIGRAVCIFSLDPLFDFKLCVLKIRYNMFWLNKWEDLKSGKGPNILLFFNKISWQFASPTWMDGGVSERKWKWLLTLWISWVTFHQITGGFFLFNFHMKEEDRRIILLHVLTNWSAMYYISVKLCSPYVCICTGRCHTEGHWNWRDCCRKGWLSKNNVNQEESVVVSKRSIFISQCSNWSTLFTLFEMLFGFCHKCSRSCKLVKSFLILVSCRWQKLR